MLPFTVSRAVSRILFCAVLVPLLLSGCASTPVKATIAAGSEKKPVKIAVMHFQRVLPKEGQRTVNCPLTGAIFIGCPSPEGTEQTMENAFLQKLSVSQGSHVIPPVETEGMYQRLALNTFKPVPMQILKSIGSQLNADAVLTGYLFCYRARVGTAYGVEQPASVAFAIYLVRVSDGAVLWKGIFEKTQKALLEDLSQLSSFIKEKGRWVTADELMNEGVDQVFKTFPDLP